MMCRSSLFALDLLWPQVWIGWICHCQDSNASLLFGHYGGHSLWRGSPSCRQYFGSGLVSQAWMLHASGRSHATILDIDYCIFVVGVESIIKQSVVGRGILGASVRRHSSWQRWLLLWSICAAGYGIGVWRRILYYVYGKESSFFVKAIYMTKYWCDGVAGEQVLLDDQSSQHDNSLHSYIDSFSILSSTVCL